MGTRKAEDKLTDGDGEKERKKGNDINGREHPVSGVSLSGTVQG